MMNIIVSLAWIKPEIRTITDSKTASYVNFCVNQFLSKHLFSLYWKEKYTILQLSVTTFLKYWAKAFKTDRFASIWYLEESEE